MDEIIKYYLRTSLYTDLGPYKKIAQALPDDIRLLASMQRMQTIHPLIFKEPNSEALNRAYGDMSKIPKHKLIQEEDVLATAIAMFNELFRREPHYSSKRKIENKLHISCRGQAILLTAILKAKGIPARVRSGFAKYFDPEGAYLDHWVIEYYAVNEKRWIIVDADSFGIDSKLDFPMDDVERNQFLFGPEAWLAIRNQKIASKKIVNIGGLDGYTAALISLMDDFNALMGNEKIYLHTPAYLFNKGATMYNHSLRDLTNSELKELDNLAMLMLEPDANHQQLIYIWEHEIKFKTFSGVLNWQVGAPYN